MIIKYYFGGEPTPLMQAIRVNPAFRILRMIRTKNKKFKYLISSIILTKNWNSSIYENYHHKWENICLIKQLIVLIILHWLFDYFPYKCHEILTNSQSVIASSWLINLQSWTGLLYEDKSAHDHEMVWLNLSRIRMCFISFFRSYVDGAKDLLVTKHFIY